MSDLDKRATMDLPTLRTALQAALGQYQHDTQLRRALIHAEGAIADRLGVQRQAARRSERRSGER